MAQLKRGKLTDFTPDPANANAGTERGLRLLDDSLRTHGAGRSLLADKNGVLIAGNKTQAAAVDIGLEDALIVQTDGTQVVIVQRTDLDINTPEGRALAYRDNRVAQIDLAWDAERLLADLNAQMLPAGLFNDDELAAILGTLMQDDPPADVEPQLDRADQLREVWQTSAGQVWEIPSKTAKGKAHRVMCGDSAGIDADRKWTLFTDPPYGINYDPSWLDGVGLHRQALSSRDTLAGDDGSLDLAWLWEFKRRMVWGFPYIHDAAATGWIVWDKQPGVADRGIVTPIEMASTTMRKGFDMVRVMWGGYYRAAGEERAAHPTQKPLGVIVPFIEAWTTDSDVIYDPYMGSGSTLVAAERSGRICVGSDIEPKYVAVTLQRLTDLGLEPRLGEG